MKFQTKIQDLISHLCVMVILFFFTYDKYVKIFNIVMLLKSIFFNPYFIDEGLIYYEITFEEQNFKHIVLG